jgi:hypothetical protein
MIWQILPHTPHLGPRAGVRGFRCFGYLSVTWPNLPNKLRQSYALGRTKRCFGACGAPLDQRLAIVATAQEALQTMLLQLHRREVAPPTILEVTQGQMGGFFGQLPYKCHLEEVVSLGH